MKPGSVFLLIAAEGVWQTALALALGLVLAAPLLFVARAARRVNIAALAGASVQGIAYNSVWHAEVDRATFSGPVGMLVFSVAVAMIFPALKAARLAAGSKPCATA